MNLKSTSVYTKFGTDGVNSFPDDGQKPQQTNIYRYFFAPV